MPQTVDEARDHLNQVTAHYREVEAALNEAIAGESTPERVLRHVELQGALAQAAQELIAAKKEFETMAAEADRRRRDRAQVELEQVESELAVVVVEAEDQMDTLASTLTTVFDLSRKRYAHRQEATGGAPRSLLARNATVGWLAWRLQDLDLPGLDHPPHHYRSPLAELLGLTSPTDQETP